MISLVIPLYNEQESLGELHRQIGSALAQMDQPYEILFIDDGSRDTSWSVVRQLAATDPQIKAIRFRRNFGKACALNVGFQASIGDLVITMDADLWVGVLQVLRMSKGVKIAKIDSSVQ